MYATIITLPFLTLAYAKRVGKKPSEMKFMVKIASSIGKAPFVSS
jgi:hypothetical protein